MKDDELRNIFTYHPPTAEQVEVYAKIRSEAHAFAHYLNSICPDSREKSLALTKLQECVHMANASIAIWSH